MANDTDRIEKKILLRAPRARVWRALTDSKEFGSWFGMKLDAPFKAGATLRASIVPTTVDAEVAKGQKNFEGFVFEILVETLEPERFFSFRWHPFAIERGVDYSKEPTTLVAFTLEESGQDDERVMLTVVESGFDRIPIERRAKAFAANEGGWVIQMTMIEKYLAQAL